MIKNILKYLKVYNILQLLGGYTASMQWFADSKNTKWKVNILQNNFKQILFSIISINSDLMLFLKYFKVRDFLKSNYKLNSFLLKINKLKILTLKKKKTFIVLKSPHINKTAREKFYFEFHLLRIFGNVFINIPFLVMLWKFLNMLRKININLKNKIFLTQNTVKYKSFNINGLFRAKLHEMFGTRTGRKQFITNYIIKHHLSLDNVYSFLTNWKYAEYFIKDIKYGRPSPETLEWGPLWKRIPLNFYRKTKFLLKTLHYGIYILPAQVLWFIGSSSKKYTSEFGRRLLNLYRQLESYYFKSCIAQLNYEGNPIVSSIWLKGFHSLYHNKSIHILSESFAIKKWFEKFDNFFNRDYRFTINFLRNYLLNDEEFLTEDFKNVNYIEEQINYSRGWDLERMQEVDPTDKKKSGPSEFTKFHTLKNKTYYEYADISKRTPFCSDYFDYFARELPSRDELWDHPKVNFYNVETWSKFINSVWRAKVKYPQVYNHLKNKNPEAFLRWADYIASNFYNRASTIRWENFCEDISQECGYKETTRAIWIKYKNTKKESILGLSTWDINFEENAHGIRFQNQLEYYGEFDVLTNDRNIKFSKKDMIEKYGKYLEIDDLKKITSKFSLLPFIQESTKREKALYRYWLFRGIYPTRKFMLGMPWLARDYFVWEDSRFFIWKAYAWTKSLGYVLFSRKTLSIPEDPFSGFTVERQLSPVEEADPEIVKQFEKEKKEKEAERAKLFDSEYSTFLQEYHRRYLEITKVNSAVIEKDYYRKVRPSFTRAKFFAEYFNRDAYHEYALVYNRWVQDYLTLWNTDLLKVVFVEIDKRNTYIGPAWSRDYLTKYLQSSYDENWFVIHDHDIGIEIDIKIVDLDFFDLRYGEFHGAKHPFGIKISEVFNRKDYGHLTNLEWLAFFASAALITLYSLPVLTEARFMYSHINTFDNLFYMDTYQHIFNLLDSVHHLAWDPMIRLTLSNLAPCIVPEWVLYYNFFLGKLKLDDWQIPHDDYLKKHGSGELWEVELYKVEINDEGLEEVYEHLKYYQKGLFWQDFIQRQSIVNSAIYDSLNQIYGPFNADKFYYNFVDIDDINDQNNKFIADFVKQKYFNWYFEQELGQPLKLWEYRINLHYLGDNKGLLKSCPSFGNQWLSEDHEVYNILEETQDKFNPWIYINDKSPKLKYAFNFKNYFFGPTLTSGSTELEHLRWFYDHVIISLNSERLGNKWGPTKYFNPKWLIPDLRIAPEEFTEEIIDDINRYSTDEEQLAGVEISNMRDWDTTTYQDYCWVSDVLLSPNSTMAELIDAIETLPEFFADSSAEEEPGFFTKLAHFFGGGQNDVEVKIEDRIKMFTESNTYTIESDYNFDAIGEYYKNLNGEKLDIRRNIYDSEIYRYKYNCLESYIIMEHGYKVDRTTFEELMGENIEFYEDFDLLGLYDDFSEGEFVGTFYFDNIDKKNYYYVLNTTEFLKLQSSFSDGDIIKFYHAEKKNLILDNLFRELNTHRIRLSGFYYYNEKQPNYKYEETFRHWAGGYNGIKYIFDINYYRGYYGRQQFKEEFPGDFIFHLYDINWGITFSWNFCMGYWDLGNNVLYQGEMDWTVLLNEKDRMTFPYVETEIPNWYSDVRLYTLNEQRAFFSKNKQFDFANHDQTSFYNIPLLRGIKNYYSYLWTIKENNPFKIEQVGKLWHPVDSFSVIDNLKISWLNGRTVFNYLNTPPNKLFLSPDYLKTPWKTIIINDLSSDVKDLKHGVKSNKTYKDDFIMHQSWRWLNNWKTQTDHYTYAPNIIEKDEKEANAWFTKIPYIKEEWKWKLVKPQTTNPQVSMETNTMSNIHPIFNDSVGILDVVNVFKSLEEEFGFSSIECRNNFVNVSDSRNYDLLAEFDGLRNTNSLNNYDPFGLSQTDSKMLYDKNEWLNYIDNNGAMLKTKFGFDSAMRYKYRVFDYKKIAADSTLGLENFSSRIPRGTYQTWFMYFIGPIKDILFFYKHPLDLHDPNFFLWYLEELKLIYLAMLEIFWEWQDLFYWWYEDIDNFWYDLETFKKYRAEDWKFVKKTARLVFEKFKKESINFVEVKWKEIIEIVNKWI